MKELQRARDLGYPQEQVAPLLARALLAAGEIDTLLKDFADTRVAAPRDQAMILAAQSPTANTEPPQRNSEEIPTVQDLITSENPTDLQEKFSHFAEQQFFTESWNYFLL